MPEEAPTTMAWRQGSGWDMTSDVRQRRLRGQARALCAGPLCARSGPGAGGQGFSFGSAREKTGCLEPAFRRAARRRFRLAHEFEAPAARCIAALAVEVLGDWQFRPGDDLAWKDWPGDPESAAGLHSFSVTQLINYRRCPRQYYFDRVLRVAPAEEMAVWNDAEAPEPPANLTATLKGAVIHRFCETFVAGDEPEERLLASFEDVKRQRQAELAGRTFEIKTEEAVRDLMPLARNYLDSDVFKRVTAAHRVSDEIANSKFQTPNSKSSFPGLWSELRFRLRRSAGILTGTIDKLLITPAAGGDGVDVEIIDFKTNRFRAQKAYLDSIDYYRVAIKKSDSAVLHNKVGICLLLLRRDSEAKKEFQHSIRLDKNYSEAYNNLGALYYNSKQYGPAVKEYKKAIKLNQESASFHSNLGTAYFSEKDFDGATREYLRAMQIDPGQWCGKLPHIG
jgi:hypothetical protein